MIYTYVYIYTCIYTHIYIYIYLHACVYGLVHTKVRLGNWLWEEVQDRPCPASRGPNVPAASQEHCRGVGAWFVVELLSRNIKLSCHNLDIW